MKRVNGAVSSEKIFSTKSSTPDFAVGLPSRASAGRVSTSLFLKEAKASPTASFSRSFTTLIFGSILSESFSRSAISPSSKIAPSFCVAGTSEVSPIAYKVSY